MGPRNPWSVASWLKCTWQPAMCDWGQSWGWSWEAEPLTYGFWHVIWVVSVRNELTCRTHNSVWRTGEFVCVGKSITQLWLRKQWNSENAEEWPFMQTRTAGGGFWGKRITRRPKVDQAKLGGQGRSEIIPGRWKIKRQASHCRYKL